MRIIDKIINFLKKEEPLSYPPDFAEVVLNEVALSNGISDTPNKLVVRYKYNERTGKLGVHNVRAYTESYLKVLREEVKIPVYDSESISDFPVIEEIDLSEVSYER